MLAAVCSEVRAMVAGPEDKLKWTSCEQMWPSHGQPSVTLKIWAFHIKSGKPGPLGTRQLSSHEAVPWLLWRRL